MIESKSSGSIKFVSVKGFGFIESDSGGDVFFSTTEIKGYVSPGDRVKFDIVPAKKGPKAIHIEPLFKE